MITSVSEETRKRLLEVIALDAYIKPEHDLYDEAGIFDTWIAKLGTTDNPKALARMAEMGPDEVQRTLECEKLMLSEGILQPYEACKQMNELFYGSGY